MLRISPTCLLLALVLTSCENCDDGPHGPQRLTDTAQTEVIKTARLVHTEGIVRIKRASQGKWEDAKAGMSVGIQDKIRTMRMSFATIEFEEGGLLRVEPESLVAVTDLLHEPREKLRRSTFTLEEGAVEAELKPLESDGSEFRILTGGAEASVLKREVEFQ